MRCLIRGDKGFAADGCDHVTELMKRGTRANGILTPVYLTLDQPPPISVAYRRSRYTYDPTDNARIIEGQTIAIELSTETIDQLFVSVKAGETQLTLDFSSQDPLGNTVTCDNIVLKPINGLLKLTVKDGAELKTVD